MKEQGKQSLKETNRQKYIEDEARQLAGEQGRKKAYLIKEEAIEEDLAVKKTNRSEKNANRDIEQLAREQTRKKVYLAKEQEMAEAQKVRKLDAKK